MFGTPLERVKIILSFLERFWEDFGRVLGEFWESCGRVVVGLRAVLFATASLSVAPVRASART